MSIPGTRARGVWLLAGVAITALSGSVLASERGMAAANEVSEASYRDFLDNWLYARAGHDRGFGPEHDLARQNIVDFFTAYGLDVTLEPFQYQSTTYYNVVGTKLGTTFPLQEYIVGAHFDSVSNPGADDNGSGTALVLEAARVLSQYDSAYTIRFIAFDREEQGLIGSSAYVNDHFGDDIRGMISADMVAYNTGANSADIFSNTNSAPLKNALADAVAEYGDGLGAVLQGPSGGSDHAPFEAAGYQACLFIEDWGNPNYHSPNDNVDMPNYIDYALATRFTRSLVGLFVDLAEVNVPIDTLEFALPGGIPEFVDPSGGSTVRVEVTGVGTEVPRPGTGLLHYNAGSGWQSMPMVEVSPNVYDAVLPAATCPEEIDYYFSAESMTGATYTEPLTAPLGFFTSTAAYGLIVDFHDNFESNLGWTEENLGASSGLWERGVPVNDPSWQYDPISDSDGSGQCYLTENAPGNTDVDDGAVRLTSPVFDMSGGGILAYDYYLYLTNSNGIDRMLVEVNSNGGTGPWTEIARHDTSGGLAWRTHEISEAEFTAAGVPPTANMRLRFTANDGDPQSIVEGGLDAFRLYRYDCGSPCPPDVNGDGTVDVLDLLEVLSAWGQSGVPADVNGDGIVDVLDLLEVLSAWGPCP